MGFRQVSSTDGQIMTEGTILAIIILLVFGFIGLNALRKENRRKWILAENMPQELRTAKLVASEKYFSTARPRKMHGTLDQLYRLMKSDEHVLLDSKTRVRWVVYKKDIVQLSVYRLILQRNGFKVADYAYSRIVTPHGVKYMASKLLSEQETIAEYDNAKLVVTGQKEPKVAENKRMCKGCAQQPNCKKWQFSD